MKPFLGDNFLLSTPTAEKLYHDYAKPQPIIDYHCHLPPSEIAENRRFDNMTQIWLEGDHYKWRAMRAAGIQENFITGNASDREKFNAWASVVPQCLGNPLYTWSHLELQTPFKLKGLLINPKTADSIWDKTQSLLATDPFTAQGIMQQMNVRMVGTTDDPIDNLQHHKSIKESDFNIQVRPSWRPDRAYKIELNGFSHYIQRLGESANINISNFTDILSALSVRLDYFAHHGCTIADHGIEIVRYAEQPSDSVLDSILNKGLKQKPLSELEIAQYSSAIQVWLGKEYANRGWVMQYHMGAQRDNNTRMLEAIGPNSGFDSIGDAPIAQPLAKLLDAMDKSNQLPKTILYGINPSDNEVLGTMIGNFQDGSIPGKVQLGSGWWFNDQKDGMTRQLMQLSQLGLLSRFVGMLTDSRSFLSYTRHEYFRRILCQMLGHWIEEGELPNDISLVGGMVEDICFHNANNYFGLNINVEG